MPGLLELAVAAGYWCLAGAAFWGLFVALGLRFEAHDDVRRPLAPEVGPAVRARR